MYNLQFVTHIFAIHLYTELYNPFVHLARGKIHLELLHQYFDVLLSELVALQSI